MKTTTIKTGNNKKCYSGCGRKVTFISRDNEEHEAYGFCGYHSKNSRDCTIQPVTELDNYTLEEN